MRVAAIDCGTNSLRLLISDVDAGGHATDVVRRTTVVRLGEGVDASGAIAERAMERALFWCEQYAADCAEHGAERVRFVATSAARDARNGAEFLAGVRTRFGRWAAEPEVISGDEEARLSFDGATRAVREAGHAGPYLVVDLGGGSTEFVRGDVDPEQALSVDVGAVRLTERLLRSDPPTAAEIAAVEEATTAALDVVARSVDLRHVATVVGLAGTVTTLTGHLRGLETYLDRAVHLAELGVDETISGCAALVAMTRADREALPVMVPGRADVIAGGAIIWSAVVRRVAAASPGVTLVTSVHDILDGMVAEFGAPPAGGERA